MDKVIESFERAVGDIKSGSVIGIAGFGLIHGFPTNLIAAVRERDLTGLTLVCNSVGNDPTSSLSMVQKGQVDHLIAAFSARAGGVASSAQSMSPVPLRVDLVPQGLLVERLRAAGAGLGPFFSPVGQDTVLAEGKERREHGGRQFVLEEPLHLDVALIRANRADRFGNISFRGTSQNFGPSFAKGAKLVIVEVDEIVEPGGIPPELVDIPGVFVDRIIQAPPREQPMWRAPREQHAAREYLGKPGRTAQEIAKTIASLLPDGSYVNLGVGLPTMLSDHLEGRDITLHAENGILGYGARIAPEDADPDLFNAGSEPITAQPGASVFDTVTAFEIARGGHLSAVILGAFQVAEDGSFANWTTPQMGGGAIGGAMDLVVDPGRLIIAMWHAERSGQPKIVKECQYDLTGAECVDLIVSDLAVIERDERGLVLRECAPGFTPDEVQSLTGASLVVDLWSA